MKKFLLGFNLMELLIVVAIVAILAAIGIPSYTSYIRKARRTDAIHSLMAIQLEQEKWRLNNAEYGDLNSVWGATTTENGHYTLSMSSVTSSGYTINANAIGSQSDDEADGQSCATLTLVYNAGITTKTPSACWIEG